MSIGKTLACQILDVLSTERWELGPRPCTRGRSPSSPTGLQGYFERRCGTLAERTSRTSGTERKVGTWTGASAENAIRPSLVAIALAIIGISVVKEWEGLGRLHFLGYDYAFFYNAFSRVLAGQTDWHQLYDAAGERAFLIAHHYPIDPHNHYVYPPQFAWMFAWMGLFPFGLSLALWRLLSILAGGLGVYWTMKTLWPRIRRDHLILALAATMTLTPFQLDLAVGNVNTLLFTLLALSFYLIYRKDRPGLGAIALVLAVLIKVTPIVILVALALQGRWKVIGRALVFGALGLFCSFLSLGWESSYDYALHFLQFGQQSMANGPAPYNQSLLGVLELMWNRGRPSPTPPWLSAAFDAYAVLMLLIFARVVRRQGLTLDPVRIGLTGMLPIAISPLVEQPHMVLTMPGLMASFYLVRRYDHPAARRTYMGLIAIAYGLQTLPVTFLLNDATHLVPSLYWIHIQMFLSFACLLLVLLAMARRSRLKPPHRTVALG